FELLVTADQFQFRPKVEPALQQALVENRVGRFVEILPPTPYHAIGLNFTWNLIPERTDVAQLTRQLFFVTSSPLHREFDTEASRFGGYMSKNLYGGRLRLGVRPATREWGGRDVQYLILAFNFQKGLGGRTPGPDI